MPKSQNKKIAVIGDLHFKEKLGYAEYISDHRTAEKNKVLDTIVESTADCDKIVFLGDQLNGRNNPSVVIKELVEFLERFDGKELYILNGNHERSSDGTSALDFLREIKNKKWIIIDGIQMIDNMLFCASNPIGQIKYKDNLQAAATDMLMQQLTDKQFKLNSKSILFAHYAISQSPMASGATTDLLKEIILPRAELSKTFGLVVGGHIHQPSYKDNVLIAGSVFTNEVGEAEKFIWKIDEHTLKVSSVSLPVRPIHKIENPTASTLGKYSKHSIVKAVFTKTQTKPKMQAIKTNLRKFDAYILVEQYPHKRTKVHFDEGMLEFSIIDLLKIYAKERQVDETKLLKGFELISQ